MKLYTQESLKADYLKNVQRKIKRFSDFLGDKQWFAGSEVSSIDIQNVYIISDQLMMDACCYDHYCAEVPYMGSTSWALCDLYQWHFLLV